MTSRDITTLMHRLFRSDLGPGEYVHLIVDDQLDRARVDDLLWRYIPGDDLLSFVDSNHCVLSTREGTFDNVRGLMPYGKIKIANPRFQGRVVIEPLGVGAGQCSSRPIGADCAGYVKRDS